MFDAPVKQYMLFAELEEQVVTREVTGVSNHFTDENGQLNKHAQAYFGLFKDLFERRQIESLETELLVKHAFAIDEVVKNAVAEYSINPSEIENAVSMQLLPLLFADLGVEDTQRLIEEVLKIVRLGLSRA